MHRWALILAIMGCGLGRTSPASQPHTTYCRHSGWEEDMVVFMKEIAAGTDSVAVTRRGWWELPAVPARAVHAVTDEGVCRAAALAHAAHVGSDPAPVDLVRVGPSRYLLLGNEVRGGWVTYYIYDRRFRFLKSFAA